MKDQKIRMKKRNQFRRYVSPAFRKNRRKKSPIKRRWSMSDYQSMVDRVARSKRAIRDSNENWKFGHLNTQPKKAKVIMKSREIVEKRRNQSVHASTVISNMNEKRRYSPNYKQHQEEKMKKKKKSAAMLLDGDTSSSIFGSVTNSAHSSNQHYKAFPLWVDSSSSATVKGSGSANAAAIREESLRSLKMAQVRRLSWPNC